MKDKQLVKEAKAGNVDAQLELGRSCRFDSPKESQKWFEKAAENGSVDAMVELADLCIYDEHPDAETAIKWYLKAAEKGCFEAMVGLIRSYEDKSEIERWIAEAEKIAGDCDTYSIFCFANALGDYPEKAEKWYAVSAERGYESAKLKLELIPLTKEFSSTKTDSLLTQIMVKTIAMCLELPEREISMDSTFNSDLGADDLDMLELIYSLEKAFGIEISDDEFMEEDDDIDDDSEYGLKIKTVKELVNLVKKHIA